MNIDKETFEREIEEAERRGKMEATVKQHGERLDSHSDRLKILERLAWITVGGALLVQALPLLQQALAVLS